MKTIEGNKLIAELKRLKKEVRELTDLLYDNDEIVFIDRKVKAPKHYC